MANNKKFKVQSGIQIKELREKRGTVNFSQTPIQNNIFAASPTGKIMYASRLPYVTNPHGELVHRQLQFGDNGSKLYGLYYNVTTVYLYEYNLSTPYDISTLTYKTYITLHTLTDPTFAMYVTANRVYLVGDTGGDSIKEYSLSTDWDITSINNTPVNTVNPNIGSNTIRGLFVGINKAVIASSGPDGNIVLRRYNLPSGSYSLNSMAEDQTVYFKNPKGSSGLAEISTGLPHDIHVTPDFIVLGLSGGGFVKIPFVKTTSTYDLDTLDWNNLEYHNSNNQHGKNNYRPMSSVTLSADGKKLITMGGTRAQDRVGTLSGHFIELNCKLDLAELDLDSGSVFEIETTGPTKVEFDSSDYYNAYTGPKSITIIHKSSPSKYYDLETSSPYDYDIKYVQSLPLRVRQQDAGNIAFDFSPDGKRLYAAIQGEAILREYALSKPWQIKTAVNTGNYKDLSTLTNPTGGIQEIISLQVLYDKDSVYDIRFLIAFRQSNAFDSGIATYVLDEYTTHGINNLNNSADSIRIGTSLDNYWEREISVGAIKIANSMVSRTQTHRTTANVNNVNIGLGNKLVVCDCNTTPGSALAPLRISVVTLNTPNEIVNFSNTYTQGEYYPGSGTSPASGYEDWSGYPFQDVEFLHNGYTMWALDMSGAVYEFKLSEAYNPSSSAIPSYTPNKVRMGFESDRMIARNMKLSRDGKWMYMGINRTNTTGDVEYEIIQLPIGKTGPLYFSDNIKWQTKDDRFKYVLGNCTKPHTEISSDETIYHIEKLPSKDGKYEYIGGVVVGGRR